MILAIGLDLIVNQLIYQNAIREVLEQIDNDITCIVNVIRKKIESPIQKVLHLQTKVVKQNAIHF